MKMRRTGTLGKDNVDESGNVTSKCKFAFLQLILSQLFKGITLAECVLTILEFNWNQRLGHKKKN